MFVKRAVFLELLECGIVGQIYESMSRYGLKNIMLYMCNINNVINRYSNYRFSP